MGRRKREKGAEDAPKPPPDENASQLDQLKKFLSDLNAPKEELERRQRREDNDIPISDGSEEPTDYESPGTPPKVPTPENLSEDEYYKIYRNRRVEAAKRLQRRAKRTAKQKMRKRTFDALDWNLGFSELFCEFATKRINSPIMRHFKGVKIRKCSDFMGHDLERLRKPEIVDMPAGSKLDLLGMMHIDMTWSELRDVVLEITKPAEEAEKKAADAAAKASALQPKGLNTMDDFLAGLVAEDETTDEEVLAERRRVLKEKEEKQAELARKRNEKMKPLNVLGVGGGSKWKAAKLLTIRKFAAGSTSRGGPGGGAAMKPAGAARTKTEEDLLYEQKAKEDREQLQKAVFGVKKKKPARKKKAAPGTSGAGAALGGEEAVLDGDPFHSTSLQLSSTGIGGDEQHQEQQLPQHSRSTVLIDRGGDADNEAADSDSDEEEDDSEEEEAPAGEEEAEDLLRGPPAAGDVEDAAVVELQDQKRKKTGFISVGGKKKTRTKQDKKAGEADESGTKKKDVIGRKHKQIEKDLAEAVALGREVARLVVEEGGGTEVVRGQVDNVKVKGPEEDGATDPTGVPSFYQQMIEERAEQERLAALEADPNAPQNFKLAARKKDLDSEARKASMVFEAEKEMTDKQTEERKAVLDEEKRKLEVEMAAKRIAGVEERQRLAGLKDKEQEERMRLDAEEEERLKVEIEELKRLEAREKVRRERREKLEREAWEYERGRMTAEDQRVRDYFANWAQFHVDEENRKIEEEKQRIERERENLRRATEREQARLDKAREKREKEEADAVERAELEKLAEKYEKMRKLEEELLGGKGKMIGEEQDAALVTPRQMTPRDVYGETDIPVETTTLAEGVATGDAAVPADAAPEAAAVEERLSGDEVRPRSASTDDSAVMRSHDSDFDASFVAPPPLKLPEQKAPEQEQKQPVPPPQQPKLVIHLITPDGESALPPPPPTGLPSPSVEDEEPPPRKRILEGEESIYLPGTEQVLESNEVSSPLARAPPDPQKFSFARRTSRPGSAVGPSLSRKPTLSSALPTSSFDPRFTRAGSSVTLTPRTSARRAESKIIADEDHDLSRELLQEGQSAVLLSATVDSTSESIATSLLAPARDRAPGTRARQKIGADHEVDKAEPEDTASIISGRTLDDNAGTLQSTPLPSARDGRHVMEKESSVPGSSAVSMSEAEGGAGYYVPAAGTPREPTAFAAQAGVTGSAAEGGVGQQSSEVESATSATEGADSTTPRRETTTTGGGKKSDRAVPSVPPIPEHIPFGGAPEHNASSLIGEEAEAAAYKAALMKERMMSKRRREAEERGEEFDEAAFQARLDGGEELDEEEEASDEDTDEEERDFVDFRPWTPKSSVPDTESEEEDQMDHSNLQVINDKEVKKAREAEERAERLGKTIERFPTPRTPEPDEIDLLEFELEYGGAKPGADIRLKIAQRKQERLERKETANMRKNVAEIYESERYEDAPPPGAAGSSSAEQEKVGKLRLQRTATLEGLFQGGGAAGSAAPPASGSSDADVQAMFDRVEERRKKEREAKQKAARENPQAFGEHAEIKGWLKIQKLFKFAVELKHKVEELRLERMSPDQTPAPDGKYKHFFEFVPERGADEIEYRKTDGKPKLFVEQKIRMRQITACNSDECLRYVMVKPDAVSTISRVYECTFEFDFEKILMQELDRSIQRMNLERERLEELHLKWTTCHAKARLTHGDKHPITIELKKMKLHLDEKHICWRPDEAIERNFLDGVRFIQGVNGEAVAENWRVVIKHRSFKEEELDPDYTFPDRIIVEVLDPLRVTPPKWQIMIKTNTVKSNFWISEQQARRSKPYQLRPVPMSTVLAGFAVRKYKSEEDIRRERMARQRKRFQRKVDHDFANQMRLQEGLELLPTPEDTESEGEVEKKEGPPVISMQIAGTGGAEVEMVVGSDGEERPKSGGAGERPKSGGGAGDGGAGGSRPATAGSGAGKERKKTQEPDQSEGKKVTF